VTSSQPTGLSPAVADILGVAALPGHIDPGHTALIWEQGTRTYAELRDRALRIATGLRSRGLSIGDRVVAHLLNRGETFELYFACAYAGLTFAPVNWRLTSHELAPILDDCSPGIVFTQHSVSAPITEAAEALGIESIVLGDEEAGPGFESLAAEAPLGSPFAPHDPHLILYTSGTTGRSKGVMLTHANITWMASQQVVFYLGVDRGTVMLLNGPMFNTATINEHSIPTLLAGGTVAILPSRRWSPRRMADLIDLWSATHTNIYPSMMEPLLEEDRRSGVDFASLRLVTTGGERCPPPTMERFRRRWPHAVLHLMYGSTESGLPTMLVDADIGEHPGSVGRCTTGMAIRIQDSQGRSLPVDEVGEIWVAGGSITPGYWNAPDLTASVLSKGWLNTGDLGRQDARGYVYLEGRSKDVIISKGQNIYPAEIESVLSEHQDLVDSAVVGIPDPEFGEAVCVAAVLREGHSCSEADVTAFLRERLASYKKPRYVVFLPELPRNPGAKILKKEIAEIVAAKFRAPASGSTPRSDP
jgi:acyl-CoA synthetase (AMP-forming)/AMP-acid ligase II